MTSGILLALLLARDLPMVSKFKFVRYGHIRKKLVLYVPRLNSDGSRESPIFK